MSGNKILTLSWRKFRSENFVSFVQSRKENEFPRSEIARSQMKPNFETFKSDVKISSPKWISDFFVRLHRTVSCLSSFVAKQLVKGKIIRVFIIAHENGKKGEEEKIFSRSKWKEPSTPFSQLSYHQLLIKQRWVWCPRRATFNWKAVPTLDSKRRAGYHAKC